MKFLNPLIIVCLTQTVTPGYSMPLLGSNHSIIDPTHQAIKTHNLTVDVVYDFPVATWIENLAVRHNGQILATEDTKPRLYQVDPFESRDAILVHEFSDTAQLLGIVETTQDIFYVASGNFSSETLQSFGEAYVFKIDMRQFSPDRPSSAVISKIATLANAKALNGLTYVGGDSNLLLVSDFILGVVWSVNAETGDARVAINSTYTRSTGFGVNGVHVHDSHLYFTNSQPQLLAKVPINEKGEAVGDFSVLAQGGFEPDDFTLDTYGNFYVASFVRGNEGLVFVPREGGNATYIAQIAGPTACAFGRTAVDRDILYVSTSGGDYDYTSGGPVTVSGKIVKVDLGRYHNAH